MLGLPGSGKTTCSKKLVQELGIARFSLDEEYSKLGGDLNSPKWNEEIALEANELIKSHIKELVGLNESVILDFCPWREAERSLYRDYIESIGAECRVYYFDVPIEELNRRLEIRNTSPGSDNHVITSDMLDDFAKRFDQPLDGSYELTQD